MQCNSKCRSTHTNRIISSVLCLHDTLYYSLCLPACLPAPINPQVKKAPPLEPSSSSAGGPSGHHHHQGTGGSGGNEDIAIGKLRGEDYNFEFNGKVKDGKMHFRLFMTQVCVWGVCVFQGGALDS